MILEKAWAKVHKNYSNVESGEDRETMHDLTGAPTRVQWIEREKAGFRDRIMEDLAFCLKKNSFIATATTVEYLTYDNTNKRISLGIPNHHSYTIIDVFIDIPLLLEEENKGDEKEGENLKVIYSKYQKFNYKVTLLRIRNPWAKVQWLGDWRDESKLWSTNIKKKVKFDEKFEGDFFIDIDDFIELFGGVKYCYCSEKFLFNSVTVNAHSNHAKYFKIEIKKAGRYFIEIN